MNNNILLIYGGNSVEHEISIITTLQIKENYKGKYNLILCYLYDGQFFVSDKLNNIKNYKHFNKKAHHIVTFNANTNFIKVKNKKIEFLSCMILVHGKNCEDGTIASYFKTLNIPIISQKLSFSAIGQDKILSKKLISANALDYLKIDNNSFSYKLNNIIRFANTQKYPLILKPSTLGSSVGISIVNSNDELINKIEELLNLDDTLLLEKCLDDFVELNIALIRYNDKILCSEIENVSKNKVLTYKDKYYNKSKSMNDLTKQVPAQIDKSLYDKIILTSKKIYDELSCSLIVRIDYLYDVKNDILYFNEINNIPGSLAFYLFDKKGIKLNELIDMYINQGLQDAEKENKLIKKYQNNILKDNILDNVKISK